jgi:hypothetical protein
MSTILIKTSDIPEWLINTELSQFLKENDDDNDFPIHIKNFKSNPNVSCINELVHLLFTGRFWGLKELPFEVFEYVENNVEDVKKIYNKLCEHFSDYNIGKILVLTRETSNDTDDYYLNSYIAKNKFIDMIKYLHHKNKITISLSVCCVYFGYIDGLKYVVENSLPYNEKTLETAAITQNVEILNYLFLNNCPKNDMIIYNFLHKTKNDRPDILDILIKKIGVHNKIKIYELIIKNDFRDCYEYYYKNILDIQIHPIYWHYQTIKYKAIKIIKHIINIGNILPDEVILYMVQKNLDYPDILEIFHTNGFEYDEEVREIIIANQLVGCYDYYIKNMTEESITFNDIETAIINGSITILRYILEKGFSIKNISFGYHSIDFLRMSEMYSLIVKYGGLIDPLLYLLSIKYDCKEFIDFMLENNVKLHSGITTICALYGEDDMLTFFISKGCSIHPETANIAYKNNNQGCLEIALSNGCLLDDELMKKYVENNGKIISGSEEPNYGLEEEQEIYINSLDEEFKRKQSHKRTRDDSDDSDDSDESKDIDNLVYDRSVKQRQE